MIGRVLYYISRIHIYIFDVSIKKNNNITRFNKVIHIFMTNKKLKNEKELDVNLYIKSGTNWHENFNDKNKIIVLYVVKSFSIPNISLFTINSMFLNTEWQHYTYTNIGLVIELFAIYKILF